MTDQAAFKKGLQEVFKTTRPFTEERIEGLSRVVDLLKPECFHLWCRTYSVAGKFCLLKTRDCT